MTLYWAWAPKRHRKRRVQKKIDARGGALHHLPPRIRVPHFQLPPDPRLDFAVLSAKNEVVSAPSKGAAILWFEWSSRNGRRVVKKTWLGGDVEVSTVFLGIDHGFGRAPRWFETMIFGGPMDGEQWRYETYKQAIKGHQIMVEAAEMEGHSTMWQTAMELAVH